jgi:hypothetical protein
MILEGPVGKGCWPSRAAEILRRGCLCRSSTLGWVGLGWVGLTGWLLDTNVLSELRRPKPERKVVAFVAALPLESI